MKKLFGAIKEMMPFRCRACGKLRSQYLKVEEFDMCLTCHIRATRKRKVRLSG